MSTVGNPQQVMVAGQYPPGMPPGMPALPGAPGASESSAAGIGPGDVMRIIKQRKVLIVVVFCLLYMMVVGGTYLVYRYAPSFYSEAMIRLVPPVEGWGTLEESILPPDYILHELQTEATGLRDPQLLQEVLALPVIKETYFYRWYGDDFDECLNDLQDMIIAAPVRDTYLIRVGISLKKKEEATLLANTLVDRYLARSRSTMTDEGRERLEVLRAKQDEVEQSLENKRQQISDARAKRDMPALESDREVQVQTIAMLNNTVAELKTRKSDVQAQLQTVRGVDPRNLPLSAEMRVIIESDPVLRFYRQQVESLDIQIAVARANTMGDEHRTMRSWKAQRDEYFQKEAARREELIDDLRARQVESLNQELSRVDNMLAEISEQLAEREATQKDIDKTIQQIRGWEQDEVMMQRELEQIGQKLLEAESQLDVQSREGRLAWAQRARDAVRPSRPNFITWLGGGFVLSMAVAVGLAFLRELTDQALRTPIDVARHGQLPVLGCVPLLDDEEADIDEMEVAARQAPHSLVAEAFRQVRAHLTFSGPVESQRTLLVTSPRPEDGKTAVAINLAVTFARGNERTLIIDCNFRRPGLRRAFENTRPEGLSNVLAGHAKLADVITSSELDNLDVVTSGPMPPNPAELLGSQLMRDLLDEAKASYDRVVLDGPPCLLVSDALIIATRVDAAVMVARAVQGTKGTLKRAREQLQRSGARVIGAVLNGVEARPGGYFRQQYREFYEYTDDEVVMRELPPASAALEDGESPVDSASDDDDDKK